MVESESAVFTDKLLSTSCMLFLYYITLKSDEKKTLTDSNSGFDSDSTSTALVKMLRFFSGPTSVSFTRDLVPLGTPLPTVAYIQGRRHGFFSEGTNRRQVASISPKYPKNRKRHRIWATSFSNPGGVPL